MSTWFRNAVKKINDNLGKRIERWDHLQNTATETAAYHSLSPIKNADVKNYTDALQWALDNRKKESIYNIALTGPYGSGKSSILQTFKDQNQNKDYVFLEISLATFKDEPALDEDAKRSEEKTNNEDKSPKSKDDLLRLIELSILQQIFYHEEDRKIPDSRFKKIKSFKRKNLIWITAGIMASCIFGLNLFLPHEVEKMISANFSTTFEKALHWISLLVFLVAASIVIFRSIRLAYGIKVSKFKFHEAEIEIDKNISKSILNNHLDEILYFFEVTDYSVVLIEDLDRFRQAEIFTKLRELNLLINNSKKVDQEVVFIYAVRDEMFRDKDRTKFFDFIIPVIPVINSFNSNEKLADLVEVNKYGISADLMDDLSYFIDDMRLLYNIMNEYHIYRLLLGDELIQDKLLAMVVYKNIFPDDFVALSKGEGKLFDIVNKKKDFITEKVKVIDEQIAVNKGLIQEIDSEIIDDETELRMIYLGYYISRIDGFNKFILSGTQRELADIAADENLFAFIVKDQVNYSYYYVSYGTLYQNQIKSQIKFAEIEEKVNSEYSFAERLQFIYDHYDDRQEKLKQEISQLEKQKSNARHLKLQQVLNDKKTKVYYGENNQQTLLLRILLQAGYIDEDYLDYISLFYEGSITKDDRSFLLNVKSQNSLGYEFKLTKINNLIRKIRQGDLQEQYVLNYNLVDYLLTTEGFQSQLDNILSQLNDLNEYGAGFIDDFITNGVNVALFIKELAHKWSGLWKYISQNETMTRERKDLYFKLIIEHADVSAINEIAKQSSLLKDISVKKEFLSFVSDEEKIKSIIQSLGVKFQDIDFDSSPATLAKFVCDHNYYCLTPVMVEKVIRFAGKFDQVIFTEQNYEAVQSCDYPKLSSYIQKHMDDYIANVYLKMEGYQHESEKSFLSLLNNKSITLSNRKKIIGKSTTVVSLMIDVTDKELDNELLEWNSIEPNWNNALTAFQRAENQITPSLVNYLSESENAKTLSSPRIEKVSDGHDEATIKSFIINLINEETLADDKYDLLTLAIPYWYSITDIKENINCDKVKILAKNQVISATPGNFNGLKSRCSGSQILLIETNAKTFLEKLDEYALDDSDVLGILQSAKFTIDQKNQVVNALDVSVFNFKSVALVLAKLSFGNAEFKLSQLLLLQVLKTSISVDDRIKLFNMNFRQFNKDQVSDIFKTFPYPFSDIGVRYTSPVVPDTQENVYLANNLKALDAIASVKDDRKGIKLVNFKK